MKTVGEWILKMYDNVVSPWHVLLKSWNLRKGSCSIETWFSCLLWYLLCVPFRCHANSETNIKCTISSGVFLPKNR